MTTYICENIRRLRRERNVTQEKLAERLGVTTQAVSRWECGDSMPDITMLLPLASFFNVTADELLGFDKEKTAARVKELLDERHRLHSLGKKLEAFDASCQAYAEFPNNFEIISYYVEALCYDPHYLEKPFGGEVHLTEIERLSLRILDECTDAQIRFFVADTLMFAYSWSGLHDKAAALADQFPESYYHIKAERLWSIAEDEEYTRLLRKTFIESVEHLVPKFRLLAYREPKENQIELYKKCIAFLELMFEDGDFGFQFYTMGLMHSMIADCYFRLGETDSALEHMERGLEFSRTYDELRAKNEPYTHTSLMFRGAVWQPDYVTTSSEDNRVSEDLKSYAKIDCADPRFKELVARYGAFAGKL